MHKELHKKSMHKCISYMPLLITSGCVRSDVVRVVNVAIEYLNFFRENVYFVPKACRFDKNIDAFIFFKSLSVETFYILSSLMI